MRVVDRPTDEAFDAACAVVASYLDDPASGRRGERNTRLRELIGTWSFALSETERYAAHDAEKS